MKMSYYVVRVMQNDIQVRVGKYYTCDSPNSKKENET
jgi:hypothetical protein